MSAEKLKSVNADDVKDFSVFERAGGMKNAAGLSLHPDPRFAKLF